MRFHKVASKNSKLSTAQFTKVNEHFTEKV